MRMFGFWVLSVVVVGTAFVFPAIFTSSSSIPGTSTAAAPNPSMTIPIPGDSVRVELSIGEQKGKNHDSRSEKRNTEENINLEDYRPYDPAPSSKANIHTRPIEHGTPLMPYIPKPTPPPSHPKYSPNHGVSPPPS